VHSWPSCGSLRLATRSKTLCTVAANGVAVSRSSSSASPERARTVVRIVLGSSGACGDENFRDLVEPEFPGQFERGLAVFVGHVRAGAVLEQQPDDLLLVRAA